LQSGQRPDGKPGREYGLRVKGFFRLDLFISVYFFIGVHEVAALSFWLLFYQEKSNSPKRQLSGGSDM
jgi:hypothetical protein